jgi:hypothetical protein
MKKRLLSLFLLLSAASSTPLFARSLENRMAAGVMLHELGGLASLSLRYVPESHYAIGFSAGFDTGSSGFTLLGARVNRHVDLQENLNAYLGLGAYYLARSTTATTTAHGYELDAVIGVEAFLPGLSDLGVSFETGLGYRSLQGSSLKTLGSGMLAAAIHYYF